MLRRPWIVEPDRWDAARVIADLDAIRRYNPQRYEMELLTAVVYEDLDRRVCVGYKDLAVDEFWARGYAPYAPIMPGTAMCEAAAQLANYYVLKHGLYTCFGGLVSLSGVHCRGIVRPGERLFVLARLLKVRGDVLTCQFQCAVRDRLVCDGVMRGVQLRSIVLRESGVGRPGAASPTKMAGSQSLSAVGSSRGKQFKGSPGNDR